MAIRDLRRCEGCKRWVTNIWAHLGCLPPLLTSRDELPYKSKSFPARKLLRVEDHDGTLTLHLECGHLQIRQRSQFRHTPNHVHCGDCAFAESQPTPEGDMS